MKILSYLSFFIFVLLSSALPVKAQIVILGTGISATKGSSYRNPIECGFIDTRWNKGKLVNVNRIEIANDRKVFLSNGYTLRGGTEVGMLVTPRFAATGSLSFGRQTNVQYSKMIISPGLGLRGFLSKGFQVVARYSFPILPAPTKLVASGVV